MTRSSSEAVAQRETRPHGPGARTATYGRLAFHPNQGVWVLSEVPPHVALRLKANFARIPKTATAPFAVKDSLEARADLEWFLRRYPMAMEETDRALLRRGRIAYETQRDEIERILLPDWRPAAPVELNPPYAFFPYQLQAIEVCRKLGRLLLIDPASAGKTLTTIGAVMHHLPAAIVVEPHLRTQWRDKGVRKFTKLEPHIIKGTRPYDLPRADIYIFSYSNLAGWVDIADKGLFRSFGADEVQNFRTGDAAEKYRAARVFAKHAELRIGVTASLIYNYGAETFPMVDLVAPGALGTYADFLREWCCGKLVEDPDALGAYLREQHLVLSRTEEEIGKPLPRPNVVPIEVPYDERVEAESIDFARTLALRVLEGDVAERGQAAMELDVLARMITGVAKAKHVAAFVRMLLQEGEPVTLAGWHRDVYAIWLRELADFNPVMYTGSETVAQKDRAKDAFVAGRTPLLILSLRSGAGLDGLEEVCKTVVFGEMDWSPRVHDQIIWRFRRWTQKRWPVDAYFCWANGGCDPLMMQVNGVKRSQARGIESPGAPVENAISDTERLKRLAKMFLARA